ncbi:MAG: hypothetical protein QM715_08265 [Nibricoccus sp.]
MKRIPLLLLFWLLTALGLRAQTIIQDVTYSSGVSTTVSGPSTIEAGPNVTVESGANVTYSASSQIVLKAGFQAREGSYFHAIVNSPPLASLETAYLQGGILNIGGWAVDRDDGTPVDSIKIYIDGIFVGRPSVGLARPDIADYSVNSLGYPGPSSRYLGAGFSYTCCPIELGTGLHFVVVIVTDRSGASTPTVRKRFTIESPAASIDFDNDGYPDYVEIASGSSPYNAASTPNPAATARYQYDANNRLTADPTRTHKYDKEGNVEGPQ